MTTNDFLPGVQRVFFLGIGGIGMSALARACKAKGLEVRGYDAHRSALTAQLEQEGMPVCYRDDSALVPPQFAYPRPETLIVYTPAIPVTSALRCYFEQQGHALHKRAEILGLLTQGWRTLAVAGSHGKTTTSTMLARVLRATVGCQAFLGGLDVETNTNWFNNDKGQHFMVVEADEYDRSFLQLHPYRTIVTTMAPDHLDYYGSFQNLQEAFIQFCLQNSERKIVCSEAIQHYLTASGLELVTYGLSPDAHYRASNLKYIDGKHHFDLTTYDGLSLHMALSVPGRHNVENALAVLAVCHSLGIDLEVAAHHLEAFHGVARRLFKAYQGSRYVYFDDYAHHPDEIRATIDALRETFPGREITGIFQPHLYSRTQALAIDFAHALSKLDCAILLPIYPARERPIPGVDSSLILQHMPQNMRKMLVGEDDLLSTLQGLPLDLLLSMGAGSIGEHVGSIVNLLKEREASSAS